MTRRVSVIGGGLALGAALAAVLTASPGVAVMPTRRPELEPGYDMNDLIDLEGKRSRKKARQERLQVAQRKAFAKD